VLELGVGTGRLALPLAARGLEVWGVDASAAMLSRLRAKPGGADVRVAQGDMALLPLRPGPRFAAVFCAYNTFFNLPDADAQGRSLAAVAALLAPGGRLAIEAFVPAEEGVPGGPVSVRSIELDRVVLSVVERDVETQTITGQFVELSEAGGVRLRPYHLHYLHPDQLDELAEAAGLRRLERWSGWDRAPFGPDSPSHVSVYG
jgi:SAM-dependent methyltransferase